MDCMLCSRPLSESKSITCKKGLPTLIAASKQRKDGRHKIFSGVTEILLHERCRKEYTRKEAIIVHERRSTNGQFIPKKEKNIKGKL